MDITMSNQKKHFLFFSNLKLLYAMKKKKWVRKILDKLLTNNNNWAEGRSAGLLARQESTNLWKSSDQSPPDRVGESFWAMWYKALIAFMLNKGGFLSAGKKKKKKINTRSGMGRGFL